MADELDKRLAIISSAMVLRAPCQVRFVRSETEQKRRLTVKMVLGIVQDNDQDAYWVEETKSIFLSNGSSLTFFIDLRSE